MNKFYNAWILIISIITLPIAFFTGMNQEFGAWDIDLSNYQHIDLVFGIAAGFIFLLGAVRSSRRWSAMRIVNKKEKFLWHKRISQPRRKRVMVLNAIEILYFLILGVGFTLFSIRASLISLVFFIFILDSMIYSLFGIGMQKFRIGMTKKAIVSVDREVIAIYFKGLSKITLKGQILYFEYVNDLVLDIPLEILEDQEEFLKTLKENIDTKKVFLVGL